MSGSSAAAVSDVLSALDGWPARHCTAAVVDDSGIVATHGDIGREFRLASVSKPLSALAVLVACEEEAVTLATPADAIALPGATVEHLLSHASGIAPEARLRMAAPGTRRIYSNAGYDLLGELVETHTGIAFGEYFADAVARPLGLTSTTMTGSPAKDGISTVADLVNVATELLTPHRLLHPSTIADATRPHFGELRGVLPGFGTQRDNAWGLGFEIRDGKAPHWTSPANSPQTYGHFGQSGTMIWIDPLRRIALIALADEAFGDWAANAWPLLGSAVLAALTNTGH